MYMYLPCFMYEFEGTPPAPKDANIDVLNMTDVELTVNLTWSLIHRCVEVYYVEVTNTNTSNITNMNTTSQYIVLTIQTGLLHSIRVRGVDGAGRGEWSELYIYASGVPTVLHVVVIINIVCV